MFKLSRAFEPQALANTAWGSAKTGFLQRLLSTEIAVEALLRIDEFNAQELANTMVWAFATAGVMAQALFEAQNLLNMVWAVACTGWQQNQVFL